MLVFVCGAWCAFGQSNAGGTSSNGGISIPPEAAHGENVVTFPEDPEEDAVLAMTMPDYLVTPGDRYVLRFTRSFTPTTLTTIVEHDFTLNFNILGKVNGRGLAFVELKRRVEQLVTESYPGSTPGLSIQSVGRFEVYMTGEVTESRYTTVTGLTRLGSLSRHFTKYSSERDVRIVSRAGESRTFDLFAARRDGREDQNPFLRPGDRILVSPYDREVRVSGQVRKPGAYHLLPGEDLCDVLERYGGGVTAGAATEAVRITRNSTSEISRVEYVDASERCEIELLDQDLVHVPDRNAYLPVVYFEGALLGRPRSNADGTAEIAESPSRVRYQFRPGETLSSAVRALGARFTEESDLANAYLERGNAGERMPVDLSAYLFSQDEGAVIALEPKDRIVVPFRRLFVTVSGAVQAPGSFPYIVDRTYEYYLGLAGGVDTSRNIGGKPKIRTADGGRRELSKAIGPEDDIFFPTNNPFVYLTPLATIIGTAASVVSVVLAITGGP